MKQSASSNDNEQTEVEEEKSHGLRSVGNESICGKYAKSKMRTFIIMCRHLGFSFWEFYYSSSSSSSGDSHFCQSSSSMVRSFISQSYASSGIGSRE